MYHADDVFAVAVLLLIEPDAKVVRTRDKDSIASADYAVDVGFTYDPEKKRFDHHQPGGAGRRENGIEYASFGLVWKEYGERLAGGKREAEMIDNMLAAPLDAHDNGMPIADYRYEGIREYSLIDFLYSYITEINEDEESIYKIFMSAVSQAKELLLREISKAREAVSSADAVRKIYEASEDKRIIVMDRQYYRWREVLMQTPDAVFGIYPRNDGVSWGVKGVPASAKTYGAVRKSFPAEWAAKQNEDLQRISGVPDAVFAHRGLFMCAAKTKEGAIELAQKALQA